MEYYYIFTILICLVFVFNKGLAYFLVMFLGVALTVFYSDFPLDYDVYSEHFNQAYVSEEFPFFFSHSDYGFEVLYEWYSSFFGVIFPNGFPLFLAINFLICFSIIKVIFEKYIEEEILHSFWVMALPVILPTIFLFSPRSSISFVITLISFILLAKDKFWIALLGFVVGAMIHSQYLPLSALLIITYLLFSLNKNGSEKITYFIIGGLSLSTYLFFYNIDNLTTYLQLAIDFLPKGFIADKLPHFQHFQPNGMRLTSLLSIIIHPFIAIWLLIYVKRGNKLFFFKKYDNTLLFMYLSVALVMYGFVINIFFLETRFLAGRLGRFADYFAFLILLPVFFHTIQREKLLKSCIIIFALIAPVLYPTLYNHLFK